MSGFDLNKLGVALHNLVETAVPHPGAKAELHHALDVAFGNAPEVPPNPWAPASDAEVADAAIAGDPQAIVEWHARKAAAAAQASPAAENVPPQ